MKKSEVQRKLSKLFKDMREKEGLSVSQMAQKVFIDSRTWARYESGDSSPTLPELIRIYAELGQTMMPSVLNALYEDIYSDDSRSTEEKRSAIVHFFENVADARMIEDFYFIAFGSHGSNLLPQLAELAVIDHLPMDYRVAIVKDVITFHRMAAMRGELVCKEECPPNFDILVDAIRKGLEAVGEHRNSYTTITED